MTTIPIANGAARAISMGARRLSRPRSSASMVCMSDRHNKCSTVHSGHYFSRRRTMRQLNHNYKKQYLPKPPAYEFSTAASDESNNDEQPGEEISDGLDVLPDLSPAMLNRIRAIKSRHDEIMKQLHDGGDQTKLGKELSSLSGIANLCEGVSEIHQERESLMELLNEIESLDDEDSEEMMEDINDEVAEIELRLQPLSRKMMKLLVPLLDPEDVEDLTSSDAVIDIRAGTGGDEACLFAAEIMAAYISTAKAGGADESGSGGKSWELEVLSVNRTDLGGIKEASLVVSSRGGGGGYSGGFDAADSDSDQDTAQLVLQQLGPYGFFQFESGVHRVQRVPVNDVKMQTSAVSVAVLPSLPDNKVAAALPPTELKIDTMRASGAGGQHVNTTESAVRVTHIPTGIMAYMQEERSQHKNKAKGLKLVAARVHQLRKEEAARDRGDARRSLMGGGDRSERIRTYNFAQDRISDHRCKVTMQGVQSWLGGGKMVRKFAPHLYKMEREDRVVALEEEDEEEERKRKIAANGGKGKAGKKR